MSDDEVRSEAAGDVQDLRTHFQAWCRHDEGPQLEALRFGEIFEDWQRLPARGIVVVEVGDLLAVQVSEFILDEGNGGTRLRPVACCDREGVRIALAVSRRGCTEAR